MLKRFLLVISLVTTSAVLSFGGNVHSAYIIEPTQTQQKEADLASADVLQAYKDISALPVSQRGDAFANSSAQKKSALWTLHMKLFLSKHPELTEEQRRIVSDAISLATPQFFEIRSDNPEWATKVDEPLQRLTQRAVEAFTPEVAYKIFGVIGDSDTPSQSRKNSASPAQVQKVSMATPDCTCSISSDWCFLRSCYGGGCWWKTSGCGTLYQYACTGLCRFFEP